MSAGITEPTRVVLVHPDDVNLADAKALAAKHGATIVANQYMPRLMMFVVDPAAMLIPPRALRPI